MNDEVLLKPVDVAATLGVTKGALAQMRYRGTGPKFVRVSARAVRYRRSDLERWIDDRVRTSSDEVAR